MNKTIKLLLVFLLPLFASNLMAQIPTNALVHYRFDNNTNDISGRGNHAVTNNTSYAYKGPTASNYCLENSAASSNTFFDFTGQETAFKSQSYSTMMWVNMASIATYGNLMELGSGSTTSQYLRLIPGGTGIVALEAGHYNLPAAAGNNTNFSLGNITTTWVMVGVVSELNGLTRTIKLYKDGVQIFTQSFIANIVIDYNSSYSKLNIGCRDGNTGMRLQGKMDDVVYYNRALSAQEVSDYYNACPFDTTITNRNDTLFSDPIANSYQWIDCKSGQPISGATAAYYVPTYTGDFSLHSVISTGTGTCSNQSNCLYYILPSTQISTNGLLVHYRFENNTNDDSGNSNHATTANTDYAYRDSISNNYCLSNTNTTSNTFFDFTGQETAFKSQNYTTMMWVNMSAIATYGNLMELGSATTAGQYFRLKTAGFGNVYLEAGHYDPSSASGNNVFSQLDTITDKWVMVGVVSELNVATNTRTITLYKNGNQKVSQSFIASATINYDASYSKLNIGHRDGTTAMRLQGKMDDVVYYNRALTAAEVLAYYYTCPFDNAVAVQNDTLFSNLVAPTYQWIDCGTNQVVVGETGPFFVPTYTGDFAVRTISSNGTNSCSIKTDCVNLSVLTSVTTVANNKNELVIFPNPASTMFTISNIEVGSMVNVLDLSGKNIYTQKAMDTMTTIETSNMANGVYVVQVVTNGVLSYGKIVVNK